MVLTNSEDRHLKTNSSNYLKPFGDVRILEEEKEHTVVRLHIHIHSEVHSHMSSRRVYAREEIAPYIYLRYRSAVRQLKEFLPQDEYLKPAPGG